MPDPIAFVSDTALGILALFFAARLWRVHRMWALAFVCTAAAAVIGGVYHGYGDRNEVLWKATVMAVGLASFFLLAGTHRKLAAVAAVKLVAYLSWMIAHDDFLWVVADYGITLILVGIFHPAKKWVWGSIAVSVAAALVQQARVTVHSHWFDYNDLYHVIQMIALWMLYRAARDVAGRVTPPLAALFALALCALPIQAQVLEVPKREESVRVIIRYRPAAGRIASTARDMERIGVKIERRFTRLIDGASATVRRADIPAIRRLPGVASVHEDRRVYATLAQSVPATRADQVWQSYATRGQGRTVAVIDTGIDMQHEAFGSRITGGWDFVNDDADADDDNGHGTHVAGIVGANGGGLTGVAPDVSLLAYKVLDQQGSGDASDVIAALERAVDPNGDGNPADRVDVVNMSLGAPADRNHPMDDPLLVAVENAVAAGIVVVTTSGNRGAFYTVGIPGIAPSAITVGAITRTNTVAGFSSRGPAMHNLLPKPELMAPGVGIVSAKAGGGTVAFDGTSMAAPHVAGIAALLRDLHPEWTPDQIKSALVSTAIPTGDEIASEGAGRVDAMAAAEATLFASPSIAGFGITSGAPVQWTSTVTVSLTNASPASRVVTLGTISGERAGVEITAPSSVTLAANQTKQVTLRLDVDNALLPAPSRGSLSFGGTITLRAGNATIRLPWMFVKASTVTVDWQSEGPFGGLLAGPEFVHTFGGSDPGRLQFFIPIADFDLALASLDEQGRSTVLFFEKQSATGNPVLAVSRALATNAIITATVDHHGAPIRHVPREPDEHLAFSTKCRQNLVFKLPAERAIDHIRYAYDSRLVKINDVPSTPVLLFDACADPVARATYTIDRRAPVPLDGDFVVTNSASEFVATPLRVAMQKDAAEPYAALTVGLAVRSSGGGSLTGGEHVRSRAAGPFWHGTMYMTAPVDPHVSGGVLAGSALATGAPTLESPLLRFDGQRIVSGLGVTPAPNEFNSETGALIALGDGPLYPVSTTAWTAARGGFFTSFHEWLGLLGERYRRELLSMNLELFDEAGTLVRTTDYMCCEPIPPGAYRVVGTASLDTVRGVDRSTVIATFDTRRADTVAPSLHTVRIVDPEGRVTRHLPEGGTLHFSVEDFEILENLETPWKRMSGNGVTVAWRRHGATEWIGATPVLTADDQGTPETLGHQQTGLHYRVDLAGAVAAGGAIDLRIRFADDAGNTTEWIGEKVFTSADAKRRTVRR